MAFAICTAACGSTTSPSATYDLVVAGGESGRLLYINAESGTIVGVAPFVTGSVRSSALDTSRTTAYLTAVGSAGQELLAVDLPSQSVKWRLPLADASHDVSYDGVHISGEAIGLLEDNRTLAMGGSSLNQALGIAAFDPDTRRVREFREQHVVSGFSPLPVSGTIAAAVLTPAGFTILVLAPNGLQTLDSIAPEPPFDNPGPVVESPDGDRLFILNAQTLYAWSRHEQRVVASTSRPGFTKDLAISPDGRSIVVTDGAIGREFAGSGKIYVYHESLHLQKTIDLSPVSLTSGHVVTGRAAFSRDGRWLFVAAGTASIGPLFGPQPAQILVFDARSFELFRAIPLNDYGYVTLFPLR